MTNARSRWIISSCAALVVGLSACGSATKTTSPPTQPAATTPAARTPQVIHVAGSTTMAAGEAAMTADAQIDSKMYPFSSITYQYDGAPPDLTAPAGSWYFAPGDEPTIDQIADIAAALGVTGDVKRLPADFGGGWIVGPEDYSAATVSVNLDAMYNWYYSPSPSTISSSGSGCAEPAVSGEAGSGEVVSEEAKSSAAAGSDQAVSSDAGSGGEGNIGADGSTDPSAGTTVETVEMPVCEEVQPPAGVPTSDEAQARATEFLTSLGLDMSSYELEAYADEWSASITAYLVLDGMRTSVAASVGYGAEGALIWASGFLGTPQRGGDYDRIGVPAAIERLNQQNGQWMGLGGGLRTDIAVSEIEAVEALPMISGVEAVQPLPAVDTIAPDTIAPDTGISSTDIATADSSTTNSALVDPIAVDPPVVIDSVPCDPAADCVPVDTPVVVTLTNARPSLEQLWAEDGTVWLLPGYAFDSADNGIYSVIAVPDEFIQTATDSVADTPPAATAVGAPTEPAPVETVVPDVAPTAVPTEPEPDGVPDIATDPTTP